VCAVIKTEDDMFSRWKKIQHVFGKVNLQQAAYDSSDIKFVSLQTRYAAILNFLQTNAVFFDLFSESYIQDGFFKTQVPSQEILQQRFTYVYDLLENDMFGFIAYLKDQNVSGDLEEYKDIIQLLFLSNNFFDTYQYLFTLANKFFEFCFYSDTWKTFEDLQINNADHPIAKLFYAIMWFHLAGNGWKNWSDDALKNIKKEADRGKEIVYIAGGSDIYQLIKQGVYNIRVIDPILPSQPKYYSEGWSFLIHTICDAGVRYVEDYSYDPNQTWDTNVGIGDIIECETHGKKIFIRRESFTFLGDTLKTRLSNGKIAEIEKSKTIWGFYDELENRLGTLTLERRFVEQSDFKTSSDTVFLISFNELYFISTTKVKGGWGINPYRFDDDFKIYVKQLHNPVDVNVVKNMRRSFENMEFNYIALGTCVN
jgi:hypothetical protein